MTALTQLDGVSQAVAAAKRLVPRLAGRAGEHDRTGKFPVDDFEDIRRAGLLGLMVPKRLGGPGATFEDYVEIAMTLAQGNGSTALIYNMHTSITGALAQTSDEIARMLGATDEYFAARDRFLTAAHDGALYGVAMSERGAGSRLSAMTASYRNEGDGYRITGSKAFVSGAGHADAYLVAARSEQGELSQFLVPADAGLTIEETWDSMGMRATGSQDVHFDAVVGRECLLGGVEGLALSLAQTMPQWLVASYAAVYVGVAQSAIDAAVAHLTKRSLGDLPAIRAKVGTADAAVASAVLTIREAAKHIDTDPGSRETNQWVYRAKLLAGNTAMDVAAAMLEVAGTSATRRGNALERIFRDARCGALQPATTAVCEDWLGAALLGASPDSDTSVPRW